MSFYIDTKNGRRDIEGAIFDMDGTLLDSMHIWDDLGARYLRSIGVTPDDNLREVLRALSLQQAAEHFIDHYGVNQTVLEITRAIYGIIANCYYHEVTEKRGVRDLLDAMRAAGVKMYVATATDRSLSQAALENNGLYEYFSGMVTCSEVGHGKDEPDIYIAARDAIGTDTAKTAVFEDALHAAQTAKDAGFIVVGVEDESALPQRDEIREASDAYTIDFSELI